MEERLEFRLYQKGIELIKKEIVTSPVALREWPGCIYSLVTNVCSRKRLCDEYKNGQFAEVIMKTLEEWVEERNSKSTLLALIQLLRNHDLNNLCDLLVAKAEMIKNAQLQSPSSSHINNINSHIQNFWIGMRDVPNFVGRVEALETLHKLVTENRVEEHDSLALLTSVHGFGGIGKTTLARMYAWKYRNYFDGNVIWIDSEQYDTMRNAFESLSEKLNLEIERSANLYLKELTEAVYNAFSYSKCLFIFDNVEDFDGLNGVKQFLPDGIIQKPYLLLTSRRKNCFSTNRILQLDVLTQLDSIDLVKEYIPGATNEIAGKLTKRLDRVPLAINQAIAYIKTSLCGFQLSSETEVSNTIISFLEEYKRNSHRVLASETVAVDGYAKNISSICEMSLKKIEREEFGKFAKHMLRYISFLNPDDITLDFVLNLDYRFETGDMDPNRTIDLLYSYCLIDINTTSKAIKVHRLVQDAVRLILLEEEELLYVVRLLAGLVDQEYSKSFSHWISIKRSCKFEASKSSVQFTIPPFIERFGSIISAGLSIDLLKKIVELAERYGSRLITRMLKAMNSNDINVVESYLKTYFTISGLEKRARKSLLLTNFVVFANVVLTEKQNSVFQNAFECLSILKITKCKHTLLLELLGTNFFSEDVNIVLDMINRSGIAVISGVELEIYDLNKFYLINEDIEIPESLSKEFPCLNYLKSSSSFTNIDELQALNLSWNLRNSIIWSLLTNLEFNLATVRSAIACICYAGCTIAEYLENYKITFEAEQEYKKPEIIVQLVNAKLLRDFNPECYTRLAFTCCLPSEFSWPYRFEYIFDGLSENRFRNLYFPIVLF